jgi:hypothetical protein
MSKTKERDWTPEDFHAHTMKWAKNKPGFETVRNLMGMLIEAEMLAAQKGIPTGTDFFDPKAHPSKWPLDRIYEIAMAAHPKTKHLKPGEKPKESVGDSIQKAMQTVNGRPQTQKPKAETPRESITRALSEVRGR